MQSGTPPAVTRNIGGYLGTGFPGHGGKSRLTCGAKSNGNQQIQHQKAMEKIN